MKTLFYIHWNESELKENIKPLVSAGYKVRYHYSTDSVANINEQLPDVLIIGIDRLPSHGKVYAEWLWEAKKRQHIPIIFSGGTPQKITSLREKFPAAVFCPNDALLMTVRKLAS